MLSKVNSLAVSILAFTVAGCLDTPKQELSQYRNAFAQVQTASEDILIDFAEAKERAEKRKNAAEASKPGTPKFFLVALENGNGKGPDAVEVHRTALRTIDKFNNILTTLAEGKSVETVRTAAGGFVEAAGKFLTAAAGNAVPGLSSITEIARTVMGEFEKARLREEFEKAVRAGAPVIDKMLAALIDERNDHLTLRADEANLHHVDIVSDITAGAQSVRLLFGQCRAPVKDDPTQGIENELNETLKPAERACTFKLPLKLSYGTSAEALPVFGEEQGILAEQAIARIRERVAAFQSNVEQFESLKRALNGYGAMLQKTRTALATLVEALDEPQKFEIMSEEFFEIAFTVKREVEAFKAARKAAP